MFRHHGTLRKTALYLSNTAPKHVNVCVVSALPAGFSRESSRVAVPAAAPTGEQVRGIGSASSRDAFHHATEQGASRASGGPVAGAGDRRATSAGGGGWRGWGRGVRPPPLLQRGTAEGENGHGHLKGGTSCSPRFFIEQ